MSPIFIFAILTSILFCGLTLDVGRMQLRKTQMQNAADAAAGGAELESERGTSTWAAAAKADAALNGFTDGQNGATVSIALNPPAGPYSGRYDAMQINITQTFKTIFMGILNNGVYTLTVQSMALAPPCNLFLGGVGSQYSNTLQMSHSTLNSTCPVYVNNNFNIDSASTLYGFGLDVSGLAGSSHLNGVTSQQSQGPPSPPPQQLPNYGLPVVTDPLIAIPQPQFSSCGYTKYQINNATQTINPGVYCGTNGNAGLTISHSTVTMNPGVYIITGGTNWDSSTVTGAGVTLFLTSGNGASYGQVQINSSCVLNLTAPADNSTGTYSMLFWLDRNWINQGTNDFQFNASFTGDGLWYMPSTGIMIDHSTITFNHYGSFVARNATFNNLVLNSGQDLSSFSGGSLFRLQQGVLVQ